MNFNITDNLTINEMPSHNSGIVEFMIFVTTIGVSVSIATVFVALITNVNKNNQTLEKIKESNSYYKKFSLPRCYRKNL